jgi:endonuclease-3
MNKEKRRAIFKRFRAQNPQPTTELHYHSAFELLVAVLLSAQATDVSVNKATAKLFPIANTPQAIYDLGEKKLIDYIKTIGLFNLKAKNLIKTCQKLIDSHGGEVPNNREALEALPGVGRKTANVILNTAFCQPTMAVDTHVFRVANRTGLAKGTSPLAIELALLKTIDKEFLTDAHHWLILHGRYVCIARKPKCPQCLIRDLCEYKDKTQA